MEGKETLYLIPNQAIEIPDLADYEENGVNHHFAGWYFHNPQTKQYEAFNITTAGTDDIDIYALWNAEIVVKTGEEISTIAAAVNLMCNQYCDYTIKVDGTIGDAHSICKNDDSEIAAASITLLGEDQSNAKIDVKYNSSTNSTALTINTAVPVEIKNLTITGGEMSGNGGGMRISNISTVTLADGVVIGGNKCNDTGKGGGIYNEGTLFIYGSAIIGVNTENTATSTTDCSNAANQGGGLYNAEGAKAYLGYKSANEKADFTGGIYYNYTTDDGGGIYNVGTLAMNTGNISYNGTNAFAAGVADNGSSFELSGGTISYNKCAKPNNPNITNHGGGVRVYDGHSFTMTGGEISHNEAHVGGGVSVCGTFTMTGGVISDNIASNGVGGGVLFERGTFKMGKRAVVAAGNDVRLNSGNMITISEAFDKYTTCAATITPESYGEIQVLSGNVNSQEAEKFALSNNEYYINESGVIKNITHVSDLLNQSAPSASNYPMLAISTEEELIQLATWVNSAANNSDNVLKGITFKLLADIELTGAFKAPIGTGYGKYSYGKSFWGTFNGNGHTISGLNTSNYTTSTSYPALFGNVTGTVKNLTVRGASTRGGIVGCICGLIENCISYVEINATEIDAGGIAADSREGGHIRHCINNGNVTSTNQRVGGIVGGAGEWKLFIDDCVNNGEIKGAYEVGGIIGHLFNSGVNNCVNTNNVTGTSKEVGGIAGYYSQNSDDGSYGINNCYNKGDVEGTTMVGGIVGDASFSAGTVRNCYNAGDVEATKGDGTAGGVIGEFSSSEGKLKIESNYYLTGTATTGIGGTVPEVVTEPTAFEVTPASLSDLLNDLNTWLGTGNNNSGNIYKSWTIKEGGDGYPEFAE